MAQFEKITPIFHRFFLHLPMVGFWPMVRFESTLRFPGKIPKESGPGSHRPFVLNDGPEGTAPVNKPMLQNQRLGGSMTSCWDIVC